VRAAVTTLLFIARLCALVLVVLGIGFWTDHWLSLIPVHMGVGVLLVACLFILGIIAAVVRSTIGLAIGAIVWCLVVLWLGANQMELLPGSLHWIVQVVHLLVGLGALGFCERLARFAKSGAHSGGQAVSA
jgi:hypothetical protein